MRYVRVRLKGHHGSYVQPLDQIANSIDGDFDGAEAGTKIELELLALTADEYEKLPEFTGW